ncbi:aminoglycoside phosphotransferase family protein [uncultured Deinococcus sp.]|uniref:aminoglycoside phosphotransferase family protein n=1 Tax=uncultured Deinococcus sp. TaxID=158789 RepID=UPI0025FC2AE7|nr:aminoglycoside phosphotransferase family protein [uncultured Deinococcus sp.]
MTDVPIRRHVDEAATDTALVTQLIAAQCPRWSGAPVTQLQHSGTDNAVYRVGRGLVVRLPRRTWVAGDVAKEAAWLPRLAPLLPLDVPRPLFVGVPGEGFPFPWAVYPWLDGVEAGLDTVRDGHELARDLAAFVAALRSVPRPKGNAPQGSRNGTLHGRDADTWGAIADSAALLDPAPVLAAWEAVLAAPAWDGTPVWIHGDLKPGNLLAHRGRLSAVIDWGGLTLGDPAVDLQPAWNLLDAPARATFRAALDVDEAQWARGRGWALSVSVIALPYYLYSNPELAAVCRRTIQAVLDEGTAPC